MEHIGPLFLVFHSSLLWVSHESGVCEGDSGTRVYLGALCVCVCEGGSLNKKTFLERFGIILTHSPTTT